MKWIPLLVFLLFASCRKGIEGEQVCRNVPLSFQPKRLEVGMGRGEILAQIGRPIDKLLSPFGRETWIYPHIRVQPTYSTKEEAAGWYLIDRSEGSVHLVLHFDEDQRLTGLSAHPGDPETFQIRNPMICQE